VAYPIIYNVQTGKWEEVSPDEAEQELGVPIGPPQPASQRPVGGPELPNAEPPAYYNPGARQTLTSIGDILNKMWR
jgi:hypothetical protein